MKQKVIPAPDFYKESEHYNYLAEITSDVCDENICNCDYGSPWLHNDFDRKYMVIDRLGRNVSKQSMCFDDGAFTCKFCEVGYNLEASEKYWNSTNECLSNTCNCEFGQPVVNNLDANGRITDNPVKCYELDKNICATCDPFYHLEGENCVENVCQCDNGVPVANQDCETDGMNKCLEGACDKYFHNDENYCVDNICACVNGENAIGKDDECEDHSVGQPLDCIADNGQKHCTCKPNSCDHGYYYLNERCNEIECHCIDGDKLVNTACALEWDYSDKIADKPYGCESCNDYFHLDDRYCNSTECFCQHGQKGYGGHLRTHSVRGCLKVPQK